MLVGPFGDDRADTALAQVAADRAGGLVNDLDLNGYRYLHSTRAELSRRLADHAGARAAYDRALALTTTPAERRFLQRRRATL